MNSGPHRLTATIVALVGCVTLAGCVGGYPTWRAGVDGDGSRVQCGDGTWSNSGGNSGACSGHGGAGYSDPGSSTEADGNGFDELQKARDAKAAEQEQQARDAERRAAAALPEGFEDLGGGAAYKCSSGSSCTLGTSCWTLELTAYPSGCLTVDLGFEILNADKKRLATDSKSTYANGTTTIENADPDASYARVTSLECAQ